MVDVISKLILVMGIRGNVVDNGDEEVIEEEIKGKGGQEEISVYSFYIFG